jgi:hypothetical protein
MTADRVVLSVSIHNPAEQLAHGQFIEFDDAGRVHLRPWSIRYASPEELDAMAGAVGLELEARRCGFGDRDFREGDDRHVSVWRRARGRSMTRQPSFSDLSFEDCESDAPQPADGTLGHDRR